MTRIDAFAVRLATPSGGWVSSVPDADKQSAWLREMERAQQESWLCHPILERQSAPQSHDETQDQVVQSAVRNPPSVSREAITSAAIGVSHTKHAVHASMREPFSLDQQARVTSASASLAPRNVSGFLLQPADNSAGTTELFASEHVIGFEPENRPAYGSTVAVAQPAESRMRTGFAVLEVERDALRVVTSPIVAVGPPEMGRTRIECEVSDVVVANVSRSTRDALAGPEPIRISVQWVGNEMSLWLGISQPETMDLSALIRRIRSLVEEQGARVSRVVCNGQEWEAPLPASVAQKEIAE